MDLHKKSIVGPYIKAILQKYILTEQVYSCVQPFTFQNSYFNYHLVSDASFLIYTSLVSFMDFTYVLLIFPGLSNLDMPFLNASQQPLMLIS